MGVATRFTAKTRRSRRELVQIQHGDAENARRICKLLLGRRRIRPDALATSPAHHDARPLCGWGFLAEAPAYQRPHRMAAVGLDKSRLSAGFGGSAVAAGFSLFGVLLVFLVFVGDGFGGGVEDRGFEDFLSSGDGWHLEFPSVTVRAGRSVDWMQKRDRRLLDADGFSQDTAIDGGAVGHSRRRRRICRSGGVALSRLGSCGF